MSPSKERRLYDTPRWRRLRRSFLATHQLCMLCSRMGRDTIASVVDHIQPHKGDPDLFWSVDNLQALCNDCHNSAKAHIERHGFSQGCDLNGFPLDSGHRWAK